MELVVFIHEICLTYLYMNVSMKKNYVEAQRRGSTSMPDRQFEDVSGRICRSEKTLRSGLFAGSAADNCRTVTIRWSAT